MEYNISVEDGNYYKAAVKLIDCISGLNLTKFETTIVVSMLENKLYKINPETRMMLIKKLNKDQYNINNYIKKLKDKKVLVGVNKDIYLNKGILEAISDKKLIIRLNVHDNN